MQNTERTKRRTGTWMTCSLLAIFPAFTNIKIASLQPEDLVLILLLIVCIAKFFYVGFSVRTAAKLTGLLKSYSVLSIAVLTLSICSLQQHYYPLDNISFLKTPGFFSFSKIVQFYAVICGFLWLSNIVVRDRGVLIRVIELYWRVGVLSAIFAIVSSVFVITFRSSLPLASLWGAYLPDDLLRARGFFNEGGPFGLYLVSILLIGLLRRLLANRKMGIINPVLLLTAFCLSTPKAAFLLGSLLTFYYVLSIGSIRKRVVYLSVSVILLAGAAVALRVDRLLVGYVESYRALEQDIGRFENDRSAIAGRISAAYIVPRMISAHPMVGIGFGNYPLMRNDPNYLGFLPAISDAEDLPALGIPGIAAELGIPVTIWLFILLFQPYFLVRKRSSLLSVVALFQPLAHVFAVQLTFFYPWLVSACAIGAWSWLPTPSGIRNPRTLESEEPI